MDHRRDLNLDRGALLVLVTEPAFRQPYALSLRRRRSGVYFLRVTRLSGNEWESRTSERTVDFETARLVLDLWTALASRVQMVNSEGASFDGKAYFFAVGPVTGYAANPRHGSVLDHTVFALDRLTARVETPGLEDPSDRHVIHEELGDALARTRAKEACTHRVVE